jgi:hypothetical protein
MGPADVTEPWQGTGCTAVEGNEEGTGLGAGVQLPKAGEGPFEGLGCKRNTVTFH